MRPLLWVDPERCQACERCAARGVCRTRALTQFEAGELPVIEMARCLGCQVCVAACSFGAISRAAARPPASSSPPTQR